MRCTLHDLPVGQCEDTWTPKPVDHEAARTIVQRDFAFIEEAPQVSATIVVVPTTDDLKPWRPRLGHDIPTIEYGHWAVLTDDSATRDLRAEREAARAAAERQALIDVLHSVHNEAITITIR